MKTLFVIANESEVKDGYDLKILSSIKSYREIQQIKKEEEFAVVNGDATQIPENMPYPNKYEILVCGAIINLINNQITALEKTCYRSRIYLLGSIY